MPEGAIGGLGFSPTSTKPQIPAEAENLRFSHCEAHNALLAVFLCPKSHAAEAEKMLYIKRSLRHSQCIKRDSRRIATVLQKIVVRILLQIVSLSVMIYKLEF